MNFKTIQGLAPALLASALLAPISAHAAEPVDRALNRLETRQALRVSNFETATIAEEGQSLGLALLGGRASIRTKFFEELRDGAVQAAAKKEPINLAFTFTAPLAYASNPEQVSKGADGDGHIDPTIDISLEVPLTGMLLTLGATADMDINFDRPANDSTTLEGLVNLDFKQFGAIVPYLKYVVDDIYASQFGDHVVTAHQFSIGFNRSWESKEDANGRKTIFAFNPDVARVETSNSNGDMYKLSGALRIKGALTDEVGWVLGGSAAYKIYTGGTNDGRNDVSLTASAALTKKVSETANLALNARIQRNESDAKGKSFTAWSIGPTVTKAF